MEEGGFEVEKSHQPDGRWSLEVARESVPKAIAFLERVRALPQQRREQEPPTSFLVSREEQKQRLERSLASNLEQTLYTIDGVREARVHLNLPERDQLLGKEIASGSASVLLLTEGENVIERESVATLVAGAAGINAGSVAVMISKVTPPEDTPVEASPLPSVENSSADRGEPNPLRELGRRADLTTEIALSLMILGAAGCWTVFRSRARRVVRGEI